MKFWAHKGGASLGLRLGHFPSGTSAPSLQPGLPCPTGCVSVKRPLAGLPKFQLQLIPETGSAWERKGIRGCAGAGGRTWGCQWERAKGQSPHEMGQPLDLPGAHTFPGLGASGPWEGRLGDQSGREE